MSEERPITRIEDFYPDVDNVVVGDTIIPPKSLVTYDRDSQKFVVEEETIGLLSGIEDKICVVGIAGQMRLGKSFIMNVIFKEPDGFALGSTNEPCTEGIWIWAKKAVVENEECVFIMLDTEGIYANNRDQNFDNKVIALTILLSGLFIYNAFSVIDQEAIGKLGFVTQLSRYIHQQRREGEDNRRFDLKTIAPLFVWLLRDTFLELRVPGIENPTDDNYMHYCLSSSNEQNRLADDIDDDFVDPDVASSNMRNNTLKRNFKMKFQSLKCFRLVRPIDNEVKLARIEENFGEIKAPFRDKVKEVIEYIYSNLSFKKYKTSIGLQRRRDPFSEPWTGSIFAIVVKEYVNSLNNNHIDIENTFEEVKKQKNDRLIDICIQEMKDGMEGDLDGNLPLDLEPFASIESKWRELTLKKFSDNVIEQFGSDLTGDIRPVQSTEQQQEQEQQQPQQHQQQPQQHQHVNTEEVEGGGEEELRFEFTENAEDMVGSTWRNEMNKRIEECVEVWRERNNTASHEKCKEWLTREYHAIITTRFQNNHYFELGERGVAELEKDFDEIQQRYAVLENKGPKAAAALHEFNNIASVEIETLIKSTTLISEAEKQKLLEAENARKSKLAEEKAKEAAEQAQKQMEDEHQAHIQEVNDIRKRHEEKMEEARAEYQEMLDQKMEEHKKALEDGLKEQAEQAKKDMEKMEKLHKEQQHLMHEQNQAMQKQVQQLQTTINNMPRGGGCCGGCFHPSLSFVRCLDGKKKKVKDVCIGDSVLVGENNKFSKVIYVDEYEIKNGGLLRIDLESNHFVVLTDDHLLRTRKKKKMFFKMSGKLIVGDELIVIEENQKKRFEKIKRITVIKESKRISIVTMKDVIVVNDVFASCYEKNHQLHKLYNLDTKLMFKLIPKKIQKSKLFKNYHRFFDNLLY